MAKRTAKKSKRPATASAEIDAELAAVALEKRRNGERPTRDELAALRRHEAAQEERLRWEYYSAIPKKHIREMSGRATEQLHRLADSFGAPFRGRTVDLGELVHWLFQFIEQNKAAIEAGPERTSSELNRYRRAKAQKAEIENLRLAKRLLPREYVMQQVESGCRIFREASREIFRRYGHDGHQILEDAVNRAKASADRFYEGLDADGSQDMPQPPNNEGNDNAKGNRTNK